MVPSTTKQNKNKKNHSYQEHLNALKSKKSAVSLITVDNTGLSDVPKVTKLGLPGAGMMELSPLRTTAILSLGQQTFTEHVLGLLIVKGAGAAKTKRIKPSEHLVFPKRTLKSPLTTGPISSQVKINAKHSPAQPSLLRAHADTVCWGRSLPSFKVRSCKVTGEQGKLIHLIGADTTSLEHTPKQVRGAWGALGSILSST